MKNKMIIFRIGCFIVNPIFKLYYNPKVIGKENIPKKGRVLLCANHIHLFDQNMVVIATKRPITYMAKKEYFDNPKTRWFFKLANCIPVDRENKDENATRRALEVLNNDQALGLFPEGTRNKTDKIIQDFKFGAISLAKKTNSPIIPCGIYGDYKFRSKNLTIVIGKPIHINKDDDLALKNKEFQNTVVKLIKQAKKHQNK